MKLCPDVTVLTWEYKVTQYCVFPILNITHVIKESIHHQECHTSKEGNDAYGHTKITGIGIIVEDALTITGIKAFVCNAAKHNDGKQLQKKKRENVEVLNINKWKLSDEL